MKPKIIIGFSIIALIAIMFFMVMDFTNINKNQKNPYEYDIEKLKQVDPEEICYEQINKITPNIEEIHGISISEDIIYITSNNSVLVYNINGNLVKEISLNIDPKCITVFNNLIYLGVKDHIEIYDTTGNKVHSWDTINQKAVITSIAVTEKFVYVADAGNRIVHQYNHEGEIVNKIGAKDVEKGIKGFIIPSAYFDVLIGRQEELWVVNPGRHAFEAYDEKGNLKSTWERTSMQLDGFSGCCNPSNIAMLSDGSFVTSEKGIERVKIHLPSGDYKCVVAGSKYFEEGTKGLDLAVDSQDRVYIVDPVKKIIRIFDNK